MPSAERKFRGDVRSVAEARTFVCTVMRDFGVGHLVDTAMLLTSELLSNSVLHAGSATVVRVVVAQPQVTVEICDRSSVMPVVKRYDVDAGTGRGMRLVEAMAARWGAEVTEGGKRVWFTLDGDETVDNWVAFDAVAPAVRADVDGEVDLDALAAAYGEPDLEVSSGDDETSGLLPA